MSDNFLPGFEPEVTRAFWTGVPQPLIFEGSLVPGWLKVYCYLANHSAHGEPFRGTNAEIAGAVGLHVGTVNRLLHYLKTQHPPGVDHSYITVGGTGGKRRIWLLYVGCQRGAPRAGQGARQARANPSNQRAPGARPPFAKPAENKPFPPMPLLRGIEERENVNVFPIPENTLPHTHASDSAGPVAAPDGIDPELGGLSAAQLRERIAAMKSEQAKFRAKGHTGPAVRLIGPIASASELLDALEGKAAPAPAPTPRVESFAPPPAAKSASKPSILTLVGRLRRVAGPEPIEELAARLAEDLRDPGSLAFFRRIGREIRSGDLKADLVVSAYKHAGSSTANCPAAVFTALVRRKE